MGTIVRTPYVAGNDVTAEGQNINEDAYVDEFNGNIDNTNIKINAGIEGIKLADAPNGVPTIKINDLAVTTAKLADNGVTAGKIGAAAVIKSKLKLVTVTQAFSLSPGSLVKGYTILPTTPPVLPTLANMLPISLTVTGVSANTEAIAGLRDAAGVTVYTLMVTNTAAALATGTITLVYLDIT